VVDVSIGFATCIGNPSDWVTRRTGSAGLDPDLAVLAKHVLTGEPLERVRRRNMEGMIAGAKPKRDILTHGEYQGVHRQRQVDIAKKLFGAMGIARDDKPMRQDRVFAASGNSTHRSRLS
jgi:hypothetical protein